jgi:hypothetical protein
MDFMAYSAVILQPNEIGHETAFGVQTAAFAATERHANICTASQPVGPDHHTTAEVILLTNSLNFD